MSDMSDALMWAREIERKMGVTRESLVEIQHCLAPLAKRAELFPAEQFPSPAQGGVFYALCEPEDGRFGLYMSVAPAGRETAPHCHGTWAVAVAVRGCERNRFYRHEERGLIEIGEATVEPGRGIVMMPEDIHSVVVVGDEATLHLHLYGLTFARFPDLRFYDPGTGAERLVPPPMALAPRR
jgi:predicted metal-dependent enzyme (double-stranded beta helix superfamily)